MVKFFSAGLTLSGRHPPVAVHGASRLGVLARGFMYVGQVCHSLQHVFVVTVLVTRHCVLRQASDSSRLANLAHCVGPREAFAKSVTNMLAACMC